MFGKDPQYDTGGKGKHLNIGERWKKTGDSIKPNKPKLGEVHPPSKCKHVGEPIDVATGRVYSTNQDIELPGPIPFVWNRTYYSDAEVNGPLGYNWHHSYHMGLYDMKNGFASLRLSDGREVVVPLLSQGETYYNRTEQLTFTKDEQGYLLLDADKLGYRFKGNKNREGYGMLSEISSAEGFRITFEYNQNGDLVKIIDSRRQAIYVQNNAKGYITKISTEAGGKSITLIEYRYDEEGNLIYIKDVAGAERYFHYKGHLLVQLTNQTGQSFYWEYQGSGDDAKCIHTWGDGGVLEYWTEYKAGQTITRNSLGHTASYFYDEQQLIYKIIDENGGVTHQHYNQYQELEVVVDPEGLSQKYEYNDFGKVTKVENENGQTSIYQYDDKQQLISFQSPAGKILQWEYDAHGRLVKKTAVDGQQLHYSYEGMHLRSIQDDRGNTFHLFFDSRHQLAQLTYPNETYRKWGYDDMGQVIWEQDVKGVHTKYQYDQAGNLIYIAEPDGNEHYFQYDSSSNIIRAKDDLHEVQFRYGSLGILLSRTQNGRTVGFSYNKELQLQSISNEAGEVYRFGLDGLGNVVSEWGFDGLNRRYERDGNGRVTQVLRPAGKWSKFQYDGLGNIVLEEHDDTTWAAYKYDADGLLLDALNQDIHVKLQRDRMGRVVQETQGKQQVSRSYDKWGQASQLQSTLGANIKLDYDNLGQLQQMQSGGWKASWQYDKAGLEIQRELSGNIQVSTQRDKYGRVVKRSIGAGNVEQARHSYRWGKSHRLHSILNEISGAHIDFEYDRWDNLISGTYNDKKQSETIYKAPDAIGNLFKAPDRKDRQYDIGGKLIKDEKYYYHYDAEGNLYFKEFISSGSPAIWSRKEIEKQLQLKTKGSAQGWIYQWTGSGMLCKVTLPQGSEVNFSYDALGRRIAKQYKGRVTRWLWDGNVPLQEWTYQGKYPPSLAVGSEQKLQAEKEPTENIITWLFEANSFVPCGKIVGEEQYSIVCDYLGTPTHGYDSQGSLIWERELDIYGSVRKGNNEFVPFLYQGQYYDSELGLAYNRFRYYDPEQGNYISQDPIGLASNNPTLYGYVYDSNCQVDIFGLLNEFGIAGYGSSVHIKDGLSAHELLQNAWLRNNGVVTGRMSGIATSNPAMALQENMMHKTISKLQAKYGLHNPNVLKNQTALQNINRNTAITRRGIYEDLVKNRGWESTNAKEFATKKALELRTEAMDFAKKNGLIKGH